jgi:hypothetical protein
VLLSKVRLCLAVWHGCLTAGAAALWVLFKSERTELQVAMIQLPWSRRRASCRFSAGIRYYVEYIKHLLLCLQL